MNPHCSIHFCLYKPRQFQWLRGKANLGRHYMCPNHTVVSLQNLFCICNVDVLICSLTELFIHEFKAYLLQ